MDYKISTAVKKDYVLIKVKGMQSMEAHKALVGKVSGALRRHKVKKALVDIRGFSGTPIGMVENYQLASYTEPIAKKNADKIAILYNKKYGLTTRFFETTTRNRGVNLMVFTAARAAVKWLTEK